MKKMFDVVGSGLAMMGLGMFLTYIFMMAL